MRGPTCLISLLALALQPTLAAAVAPAVVRGVDRGVNHAVVPARRVHARRPAPQLVVPDSGWVTSGDGANIRITGVRRGARVTLRARRTMLVSRQVDTTSVTDTVVVESWAEFRSGASEAIDIDRTTPLRGSWTTRDALGMFWSMRRVTPVDRAELTRNRSTVQLTLVSGNTAIARAEIRLRASPRLLTRRVVMADRLVGAFAAPAGAVHAPVVIALHGSEGGDTVSNMTLATRFAARGYAAFAVSYVAYPWTGGLPGVPGVFDSIDVATLDRARDWIGAQREADTSRTAVWGVSKGGELAMVVAARRRWPRAIVGCVPSDVMWAGFGREPAVGEVLASWSDGNKRLPAIAYENYGDVFAGKATSRQVHDRSRLAHADQAALARIPIENATAPVLLLGSDSDEVWNSGGMVRAMSMTRFPARTNASIESHVYADAGHGICGTGTAPAAAFDAAESPQALGTARAAADAWRNSVAFLRRVLAP
jgi:dienelactone hydrolase